MTTQGPHTTAGTLSVFSEGCPSWISVNSLVPLTGVFNWLVKIQGSFGVIVIGSGLGSDARSNLGIGVVNEDA